MVGTLWNPCQTDETGFRPGSRRSIGATHGSCLPSRQSRRGASGLRDPGPEDLPEAGRGLADRGGDADGVHDDPDRPAGEKD